MSLNKRTKSSNSTFLKIFGGKIVQESSKPFETEETLKERENKNGTKVYYVEYDSVSGNIRSADIKHIESLAIDIIELEIVDVVERYVLSIPVDSRFGKSFMMRMMNIDLDKPVEIVPYSFTDKEDKKVSGLNIFQDGEKLAPVYTRDNPNGLPDAKQVRKGKETKWDFTDQMNFLYDEFDKFKEAIPVVAESPKATAAVEDFDTESEDFDDLPF